MFVNNSSNNNELIIFQAKSKFVYINV